MMKVQFSYYRPVQPNTSCMSICVRFITVYSVRNYASATMHNYTLHLNETCLFNDCDWRCVLRDKTCVW